VDDVELVEVAETAEDLVQEGLDVFRRQVLGTQDQLVQICVDIAEHGEKEKRRRGEEEKRRRGEEEKRRRGEEEKRRRE
jgi:hypothetical protein